jgi:hypothetical protein
VNTDVWHSCFFGWIRVPARTSQEHAEALAHIAWKGGAYEDAYLKSFARWFRRLAERRPDLAAVKEFDLYPIDELRWIGPYNECGSWRPPANEPIAKEPPCDTLQSS